MTKAQTLIPSPGSIFTAADMARALAALDLCLQDYAWKPGEIHFTVDSFFKALKTKDITFGLAFELLRRLKDKHVFTSWSDTIPAGYSVEQGLRVFRHESQTTHCLGTTQERWHRFLLENRRSCETDTCDVPSTKSDPQPVMPSPASGATDARLTPEKPEPNNLFQNTGAFWTLSFKGKAVSLSDQRGLHYLAALMRCPGKSVHAAVLRAEATGSAAIKPSQGAEVLDERAMRESKDHYNELMSELEKARTNNDSVRLEKIQKDLHDLSQYVSRATGIGQRPRKLGDEGNKIRKAVSMAISRTLNVLEKKHPLLAQHLSDTVQMGRLLVYDPPTPVGWTF